MGVPDDTAPEEKQTGVSEMKGKNMMHDEDEPPRLAYEAGLSMDDDDDSGVDRLLYDDEVSTWEAAFLQGYDEAEEECFE